MAEFKLGRIRFVWKDAWSSATTYYKDDVVRFGGKVYICVIGHTSATEFFTDFEIVPPKWNLVSDGQTWKGDWTISTGYVYGDIVQYGARLYICKVVHTSQATVAAGLEADIANWDVYAEGLGWKGDWTVDTKYLINDLVKYGGQTYVCKVYHTSAATEADGLEANQANWDVFNAGIEYKSSWTAGTRYKVNDVAQYGAALWICTAEHTAASLFSTDNANWEQFVRGFQFEADWEALRNYQKGDIVRYGGNQYIALTNHAEKNPVVETTDWQLFSQGLRFLGDWQDDSTLQDYRVGEVVRYGGYTYLCIQDHQDQTPTNTSYWQRLNTGLRWRGAWVDDVEYLQGDVARYGDNSYVCVLGHFSEGDDFSTIQTQPGGGGAQNSRPDLDTTGTYWQVIAIGNEASVLTTKGDLVYYAAGGPARLPIGAEGQFLQVGENQAPEWAYSGVADDIYYVATHGKDEASPIAGRTIDRPWKSIRYACDQVENGAKNPNAKRLLDLNRYFIQREIVEWTDAQITSNIAPFSTGFDYDSAKCERDMGYIVDALIHDITHGGNVKSREAALSYVNDTVGSPYLTQKAETKASIEYGLTVIQAVLNQTAPAVNYQVNNGDNSTAVVSQIFDANVTAESVYSDITGLVKIITDAITAGVATGIPDRLINTVLIKVATGKYYEVLPIQVPAETCVIGDELRATNVQPRKSNNSTLTDAGDYLYSNTAIERVEAIIGDIVEGVSVTATTGNSQAQSAVYPLANNETGYVRSAVEQLARLYRRRTDWALGRKEEAIATFTLADEMTDPNAGYARNLLIANRDFLKAELIGYITENYPDLKYSKTACKKDVGYLIDAVSYDLTYGGNWQTVNAGEAYHVGATSNLPAAQKAATLAAYGYLKGIMQTVGRNITVTPGTQSSVTQVVGTPGDAASATTVGDLLDDFINIVDNGTGSETIVYPSITGAAAGLQTDHSLLGSAAATIKTNTTNWITANFPNLTYDSAKCERDVGYLLDAARYDWCLGTTFASTVAAISYLRKPSAKVTGVQKDATLGSYEFARNAARAEVSEAASLAQINNTFVTTNDIILGGSNEGTNRATDQQDVYAGIQQLELNKEFIAKEATAYVNDYYSDTVTATTASSGALTITSTGWLRQNRPIKFTGVGTEVGGLTLDTTYYVKNILSSTTFTISATIGGADITVTDDTGAMAVEKDYDYNVTLCERDIKSIIDAMKWDLKFAPNYRRTYTGGIALTVPATYKTRYASRFYVNSVLGSQEEDFYYLRNGTGLRLQTLEGLNGDMTAETSAGTSRMTAGAYASLDPGWGPDDNRVWITARSPYVQNCTTFGNAATGQRIDGALHNGGNDSIVSNDFTQVISDGIGAHILNNGRAELVSVFTYYSHIGYLAETGGRIRATNGNNSYGDFGSVAEGVDPDEVPTTGVVDNKTQYNATIASAITDQDKILAAEFTHAGNDYTEVTFNTFGPGSGEVVIGDEFRDEALIQARVIDDQVDGDAGGSGYLTASNTAQAGDASSITLSATDGNLNSSYPGMKVLIVGGAGAGLYALIDTYDAGTKVATVIKESDGTAGWDHFVPGTTFVAPNASSTYEIEPAVSFTAPTRSTQNVVITSNVYEDFGFFETSEQVNNQAPTSYAGTGSNLTFNIDRVGSKYYVALNSAGSGYTRLETVTVAGTSLGGTSPENDLVITLTSIGTSGEVIDFDFTGIGAKGKFVALSDDTSAATSGDVATWSNVTLPQQCDRFTTGLLNDGSSQFKSSAFVAVATGSSNAVLSQDLSTFSTSALPGGLDTSTGVDVQYGYIGSGTNRFIVIGQNDTDIAYSDNAGSSWTLTSSALPNTGFTSITRGMGLYVTVRTGSNQAAWSADGISWTAATLPASSNWSKVVWGNGRFIAIADNSVNAAYSLDGINWTATTIGTESAALPTDICYGQGMFMVTSADTNSVAYSEYGLLWDNITVTANVSGYKLAAFGNINREPAWLAIADGTTTQVASNKIGARARGRVNIANEKIFEVKLAEPGSGYGGTPPTITITDPNNIDDVVFQNRLGDGALSNPSFADRGTGFSAASMEVDAQTSNGNADFLQNGSFVAVKRLTERPVPGSNITFASLPGQFFKLVTVVSFLGTNPGSHTAFLQLSPAMTIGDAPTDGDGVTSRIRYSQVRLTGHDFLDIGTGSFAETNYPGLPTQDPDQTKETFDVDGGRVFFTSTDQDGNFRVGDLFQIEQATGVANLNAEAFNIAGLQELTLGEVTLGGNSAAVSEFSTDPFFTANSDSVVPTQRAIKAYIEAQIGGGGAALNVNSVTAGDIFISSNIITTASGELINITANMNFTGPVTGYPLAYQYFLR
jgi:hypothetical protein